MNTTKLKLNLLTNGMQFSNLFIQKYNNNGGFIKKRRAYGTGDSKHNIHGNKSPQEIILRDGVIIACNYNPESLFTLDYIQNKFVLLYKNSTCEVRFPTEPDIYGQVLSDNSRIEEYVTVYGDKTLGFFSPGICYYFKDERQCKFCSLEPARSTLSDHKISLRPEKIKEVLDIISRHNVSRFNKVLLNGGTVKNYDMGFNMHIELMKHLSAFCLKHKLKRHLISLPPQDFTIMEKAKPFIDSWAISLEIFDPELFNYICPGKSQDYGRAKLIDAYKTAINIFGSGNIYVGFVAGIEPVHSLITGMYFFAELGIVPAVAVFHPDHGSFLENHPRPSYDYLYKVYSEMTKIYRSNSFKPFIEGSGRNSLDTEAYNGGLFNE